MHFATFLNRFKRITNSGYYQPEIDGLRFVAIFLVGFCMHLGNMIRDWTLNIPYNSNNIIHRAIMEGGYGVSIFFIISGFILSVPFAHQKLLQQKPVNLKEYYLRRISRIEPPYFISLLIFLIIRVWILHYDSLFQLLPNFIASAFYIHNIVYGSASTINGVAWSLEVEIQFYVLAPLLTNIYYIKNKLGRRILFFVLILVGAYISYVFDNSASILTKGCYFFCGMLAADWYVLREQEWNGKVIAFLTTLSFIFFQFVPSYYQNVFFCLIKILAILFIFYICLTNDYLKKILSVKIVTVIGGMCYSIYLTHMGVYGLMRHGFFQVRFTGIAFLDALFHYFIAGITALTVGCIFFLLIEKPTMKRRWYKNLFKKLAT